MARVVNTDTMLGRRAAVHRVWLTGLFLAGALLAGNLARGVVAEMGGVQTIREVGVAAAASGGVSRVFTFPGGHLPPPHATRQLIMLALHLVGLGAISQLVWLPLMVLRTHAGERQVLQELRRLPDDYWVLTDLLIPGLHTPSQVDHVLVSPYGLWCLETKAYPGHVVGGENDYEWLQLKRRASSRRHGHKFFNPVRQNTTHCARLSDHLMQEQLEAPVRSMIVFTAAAVDTMTITPIERAGSFVQTILRLDSERVMDHHRVERIVGSLSNLLATKARAAVDAPAESPAPACAAEPHRV